MTQPIKLLPPALKLDKGKARPFNEDWAEYEVPQDPDLLEKKGVLLVVADGMGGHERGQEASRTAVKTVISAYYGDASPDVPASLVRAFGAANTEVYQMSSRSGGERAMGTTLVAAVVRGDDLFVAHVGDSRAYLVRRGAIYQLTTDHTWVEEQKQAGVLTDEQARTHPQRGVITRAIGADPDVQVDTSRQKLQPGDAIVLCSDGLTGQMTDEEIRDRVVSLPPREAAQRMVDTVNQRGGLDNISVLIAQTASPEVERPALTGSRLPVVPIVGLAALLLFVGLGAFGVWRLVSRGGQAGGEVVQPTATETLPAAAAATQAPSPTPQATSARLVTTQPAVGAEETRAPTATLREALPPTSTPTPAPIRATGVLRATATPGAGTGPPTTLDPAPELVAPQEQESVIGAAVFRWTWSRGLGEDEVFDLHVWLVDKPERSVGTTRETERRIEAPPDGAGRYRWRVVVMRQRPGGALVPVSEAPAPITLEFWRPAATPTPTTPVPEATTPVPPG